MNNYCLKWGDYNQSALFITAAGLVALIPVSQNVKTKLAPFAFICLTIFTFVSMIVVLTYIEQILGWVGLSKYESYFHDSNHFVERDFGSGIGVLIKILFSIYIICNTKNILRENKNYWILIILLGVFAVTTVLANEIVIFSRITIMLYIAPVVAAFILLRIKNNRQIHYLVLVCFAAFVIMSFIKEGFSIPSSYGDSKLNPYATIFELY